jgi:transposase
MAASDYVQSFNNRLRLTGRPQMEACGGAHHWARELTLLGHKVKLIPPAYVKPFVKRNKNDAVDAEAICEAAQRPSMRFVAIKSEEQQASALVFRTRDLLVRQRTQGRQISWRMSRWYVYFKSRRRATAG